MNLKAIGSSPKTTALGAVSLAITALMGLKAYLSGEGFEFSNYMTQENLNLLFMVVIGVITGLIGLFSKDTDKKSAPAAEVRNEAAEQIKETFKGVK